MKRVMVVVPCGQRKIWDRVPEAGPTSAKDAYIGPPFQINRAFAEKVWRGVGHPQCQVRLYRTRL